MALLTTLGLTPTANVAKAIAASSGPDPKAAAQAATADFDRALKGAVAFAGQIKDKALQAQFVQALKGADAHKRAAAKAAADEQRAAAEKALADLTAAKEAADQAIAEKYKAEAKKIQGQVQATHRRAYDAWSKLEARQKALADKLKVLDKKDPARAKLEAAEQKVDKKVDAAHGAVEQTQADLKAIADFESKPVDLAAVLVRQKSNADLVTHVEVDLHELESKLPGEKHVTTTTTTFKDGKATIATNDSQRTIGLDGVTSTNTTQTETIGKKGTEPVEGRHDQGLARRRDLDADDEDGEGRQEGPHVVDRDREHAPGGQGRRHRVHEPDGDEQGRLVGLEPAARSGSSAATASSRRPPARPRPRSPTRTAPRPAAASPARPAMKAGKDGYGAFSGGDRGHRRHQARAAGYSKGTLSFGSNVMLQHRRSRTASRRSIR